jgi:hypothetical protein
MIRDPETGWIEASVTINGRTLSFAEAMSLRVAVGAFRIQLEDPVFRAGLGAVATNYDAHLARVEQLMITRS